MTADPMATVEPLHRPGNKTPAPALSPKAAEFLGKVTVAADFKPHLERRELVKHWLGATALSVVYGDSNTGKSFFAISLADQLFDFSHSLGRIHRISILRLNDSYPFQSRHQAMKLKKTPLPTLTDLHLVSSSAL